MFRRLLVALLFVLPVGWGAAETFETVFQQDGRQSFFRR